MSLHGDWHAATDARLQVIRVRIAHLDVEVKRYNDFCERLSIQLASLKVYRGTTPSPLKGWPIEAFILTSVFALLSELFAMRLLADRIQHLSDFERSLLAIVLASSAFVTGLILGELAYRTRVDRTSDPFQQRAFAVATVIAVVLIVIEWSKHFFTLPPNQPSFFAGLDATALIIISVVVLVLPIVVSRNREAWATAFDRWHEVRLSRQLGLEERRLDQATFEREKLRGELQFLDHGTAAGT